MTRACSITLVYLFVVVISNTSLFSTVWWNGYFARIRGDVNWNPFSTVFEVGRPVQSILQTHIYETDLERTSIGLHVQVSRYSTTENPLADRDSVVYLVSVPDWMILAVLGTPIFLYFRTKRIRRKAIENGHCVYCGYDLRRLNGICSECGKENRHATWKERSLG